MIQLHDPKRYWDLHKEEFTEAVARVFRSGRYLAGPENEALETEAAWVAPGCEMVTCSSGTAAIYLAIQTLGLSGATILTCAYGPPAVVAALRTAGANLILGDCGESLSLSFGTIKAVVEAGLVQAVYLTHLFGIPASNLKEISSVCSRHGVVLIEDCSQCVLGQRHAMQVGTAGDAVVISCYPTKPLGSVGNGGLLGIRNEHLAERARWLREYGWKDRGEQLIMISGGFNFRMSELEAAQIRIRVASEGLRERMARASELYERYEFGFSAGHITAVRPPRRQTSDVIPALGYPFTIFPGRAKEMVARLRDVGLQAKIAYPHLASDHPACLELRPRVAGGEMQNAPLHAKGLILLPLYPELTEGEVEGILATVEEIYHA